MGDTKYNQELDFLKDGPWDELYVLTEHWRSDFQFYKDDLRFLHHLIDKYFMWITKPENFDLVEDPNRKDAVIIKTEHEHLEEEMANITKA